MTTAGGMTAPSTVLLQGIPHTQATAERCDDLVASESEPPRVLYVSLINGPEYCVGASASAGDRFADVVVLAPDTTHRSAAGTSPDADAPEFDHVVLDHPRSIPQLGGKLTDCLYRWEEADEPTRVCFDSLTAMLQFHSAKTVFKFLHVFRGHLQRVDAVGHFHVDPTAHDDQTVAKLATLFDSVVRVENGERLHDTD